MTPQQFSQLSADLAMPVQKLEHFWRRAQSMAPSEPVALQIFKNTVSMSGEDIVFPDWWLKRTDASREKYLKAHPASKFAKAVVQKRKEIAKKLGKKESEIPLSAVEKQTVKPKASQAKRSAKPAQTEAEEQPANTDAAEQKTAKRVRQVGKRSALRSAIDVFFKRKKKIAKTLGKHATGLKQLGRLALGQKMTKTQLKQARSTVKVAGALLLGGLAGIAMFTPLSGLVPEFSDHFLNFVRGDAEAMASDAGETAPKIDFSKFDYSDPEQLITAMHEWLVGQDVEELVATLKARKEQQQLT